jgi:hypothetical protein
MVATDWEVAIRDNLHFPPKRSLGAAERHFPEVTREVTLPPTFIQHERDSGFEFCPFGRVGQRGLSRSLADCAASGPVAG